MGTKAQLLQLVYQDVGTLGPLCHQALVTGQIPWGLFPPQDLLPPLPKSQEDTVPGHKLLAWILGNQGWKILAIK